MPCIARSGTATAHGVTVAVLRGGGRPAALLYKANIHTKISVVAASYTQATQGTSTMAAARRHKLVVLTCVAVYSSERGDFFFFWLSILALVVVVVGS